MVTCTLQRVLVSSIMALSAVASPVPGQSRPAVADAIIGEKDPVTPEISTTDLKALLEEGKTPVLDVRSAQEYAIAHIPGSINHYEKEVEQITRAYPEKSVSLVLYCNGPYCGKSKRVSEQLVKQGYTKVRRYQLGLPVWRALGNTVQTDITGVRYILSGDRTAVWVDARSADAFAKGSFAHAVNITTGQAEAANDDGRLPKKDKGTRVIVFGETPEQARAVAEEIAHKAYWNSSYFGGRFSDLTAVAAR